MGCVTRAGINLQLVLALFVDDQTMADAAVWALPSLRGKHFMDQLSCSLFIAQQILSRVSRIVNSAWLLGLWGGRIFLNAAKSAGQSGSLLLSIHIALIQPFAHFLQANFFPGLAGECMCFRIRCA